MFGNNGSVLNWQSGSTSNGPWTNIANTTTTLSTTLNTTGTIFYRAQVQSSCGSPAYTSAYPITVNSGTPPVGGSVNNVNATTCSVSGTLTLSGHTGTISKWQSSTDGVVWTDLSANTSTSQVYTAITSQRFYRAVITSVGCGTATSTGGQITFNTLTNVSNVVNDLACGTTATGSLTTTITGGAPTLTYQWSHSGTQNGTYSTTFASPILTPSPTLSPTNLYPGRWYRLTVTDACGTSITSTPIQMTSVVAMTISATSTDVNCFGGSTGTITAQTANGAAPGATQVTVTDGTNTYTQTVFTAPSAGVRQFVLSNLPAGTYTVSAVDATSSCNPSTTVTITQPATALAFTGVDTDITCNGASTGAVDVTITGVGSTPATYTYAWTGPNSYTASTQDISSLVAGTYSLTVTDACGATATQSFSITQPAVLAATLTPTNVTVCNGNNNGSIVVSNPTGGAGTYEYSINGTTWQSSGTFTGLTAGTYQVSIRDAASTSCVIDLDGTAGTQLTEPTQLTGSVTAVNVTGCFNNTNGSITATATGGSGTYQFSIDGNTWQTSGVFPLGAGTYQVSVRDAANITCTEDLDGAGTVLTQPVQLTNTNAASNFNGVSISCNGGSNGSITATPAGGTSPYTYQWYTGSNTSSSISGATAATLSNRHAGAYTVQVTDANGCTTTTTTTLTEPALGLNISKAATSNVSCFGGSNGVTGVDALFVTAPYTYAWNGPGTFTATTANISGLIEVTYNVTVTDNNGCTATLSPAIVITQPTALAITATSTDVICNGGSTGTINATVTGGSTPYNAYAWTKNGAAFATTEDLNNITIGTYVLTVTDNNGCTATMSTGVTIAQPVLLSASVTASAAICQNQTATFTITGTVGDVVTYNINGG